MNLEEIRVTPIWALYEKGRNYHRRVGIYDDTDRNYRMYNGRGIRSYLLLQYAHKQAPRLTITAKLGHTHYLDRDAIGSGAAMIDTNHQEDIQLQARYTFRK